MNPMSGISQIHFSGRNSSLDRGAEDVVHCLKITRYKARQVLVMIHVKVAQVSLSNMGFVVLLRGIQDERTLPIFIGGPEAQSIGFVMEKVNVPRPLTHDLFKSVMDNLECRMKRVEISELKDNTFYARLLLERDGMESDIDARPSDAIALALRFSAPIYVAEEVMNTAGVVMEDEKGRKAGDEEKAGPPRTHLEALEQKLERAIKAERYEDAAKLRDEIRKLKHSN